MLTQRDKSQLANLAKSDTFRVLQQLASDMIDNFHKEIGTGETEFQYLKSSLERDGKILGIDLFLKGIEKHVNSNRE